MEEIYKELDETKAAMAKLMEECKAKSSLAESLRSAHDDQLAKIRQMKQQMENQTEELKAKSIEIDDVKRLYEELGISFRDKEAALRQLNSVNEQIRASCTEKLQEYEEGKKQLISALDGASMKSEDQERQILAFRKEIENLKGALSVKQKICSDADEKVQTMLTAMKQMEVDVETNNARLLELSKDKVECEHLKAKLAELEKNLAKENSERMAAQSTLSELRKRDGVLNKFEEENSNLKDQLKWKKEQFSHLEEALKKLQDEFQARACKWQDEKNESLDTIGKLQEDVNSKSRMLEDFKLRLQMCHQALTYEENRRKLLEIQVKETNCGYENILAEFEEDKTRIESFTSCRDKEMADLRVSLAAKEALIREMNYKQVHLEQENQELQRLVDELQESRTAEAGTSSSLAKLQHKVKALEKTHKECPKILTAKEAEWSSKVEQLIRDLDACHSDLNVKGSQIHDLQMELENCQTLSTALLSQNEENCLLLLIMSSEISQAQFSLDASKLEIEQFIRKKEEEILNLKEQVDKKQRDLEIAMTEIEDTKANMGNLLMQIQSLDTLEQQSTVLRSELRQQKEMLDESLKYQDHLREEASKKESALRQDLNKASYEIEKAYADLADKTHRQLEMDFELQRWKSAAERLKETQKETEAREKTYHALMEEQRKETEILIHNKEEMFRQERGKYQQIIASKSAELEQFKEKMLSLEEKFEHGLNVTLTQKKFEIQALSAALTNTHVIMDKISASHVLDQLDVDMKNDSILELEEECRKLKQVRLHGVQQEQTEIILRAKLKSVESSEHEWNQMIAEKEKKARYLKQKLESEKQFSLELKEKLLQLESEKPHTEKMLAMQNEQMEQLKSKLTSMASILSDNNNATSKEREEIQNLIRKLQAEREFSLELKQQIQLLEDELKQKLQTEESLRSVHQEQLLQLDTELKSLELTKSMDKDLIANLEQQTETLTQKLLLEERASTELRERIQMVEDELDCKVHAQQELLALHHERIEQVNARLRSKESTNSDLNDEIIKLREEIKVLEEELIWKERQLFEMKERTELLEGELHVKLHAEEEQWALQQEETDLLNAKLLSIQSTNNELNNVILKLREEVEFGREMGERQSVQIRNCEEQLRTSKDTITSLLRERDELKSKIEFFAKLPDKMDIISQQDLELLKSFDSILEDLGEKNASEKVKPFCGDRLSKNDASELAVADLIRENQKLLEDLVKLSTPRKEILRIRNEESTKLSAAFGKHGADTSLERLPFRQLNGY